MASFLNNELVFVKVRAKVVSDGTFDMWKENDKLTNKQMNMVYIWNENAPPGMRSQKVTGYQFAMNQTSIALIDTGLIIAIGAVISGLICVFFSTRNIMLLFLSIISISEVIVSVVAWINMVQWEYGLVELLSGVIVNGFPLNMVIRLTLEYYHAPKKTRNDKMQYAFE